MLRHARETRLLREAFGPENRPWLRFSGLCTGHLASRCRASPSTLVFLFCRTKTWSCAPKYILEHFVSELEASAYRSGKERDTARERDRETKRDPLRLGPLRLEFGLVVRIADLVLA